MESELFEKIREFARGRLSGGRFAHSERVADTAVLMCRRYGLDEDAGRIAGIAHDICKEIPDDEIISLASMDGLPFEEVEKAKPGLLHGRAAAVVLRSDFGIRDKDILDAVANHTFGRPGLCDLGKILFVADKIEPGRPQSTDEYRENLLSMSLAGAALSVAEENIDYLKKKGKIAAPITVSWVAQLRTGGGI